jgi:hypothetical protein
MSNYARDSYRRRRQEEQMMFQRIAAEEAQIQKFLLLQQDDLISEFIGGEVSGDNPYVFTNPPLTLGSSVAVLNESPFSGGGNSYRFTTSTSSFISTPGSSDWSFGTGDFTVEWFSYQTNISQFQRIFTIGDYPSIEVGVSIENGTFYYWANDSFRYSSSSASTINQWYHWAVVRESGITKIFRDGQQLGSQITDTNVIDDITTSLYIGNTNTPATNSALVGRLTNLRIVKGLAVYSGDFIVPTSNLTAVADANPYGGSNTRAIGPNFTKLLLIP